MAIYLSSILNTTVSSNAVSSLIWVIADGDVSASIGKGYIFDTSQGSKTLTLPSSPSIGDKVGIKDIDSNFTTNNLIVVPSSKKIEGSVSNFIVDINGYGGVLIYTGADRGWVLFNDYKQAYLPLEGGTLAGGLSATSFTEGGIQLNQKYEPKDVTIQSHISSTTNPHTVNKSQIGLSDVDNTSDANKPVSTVQQTALNLKADLASPALTGIPTAPTASADTNTTQVATTAYVKSQGFMTDAGVTVVTGTAPVTSSGGSTPNISMAAATSTVNGYMTSTYAGKLDGIESGATGDMTANEILTTVKTVDGTGSGLDADLLDGHDTSYFQVALGYTAENTSNKNALNGYAGLSNGKIDQNQLPAIAITNTFVVASQAAMLAIVCETGDVAVRTDLNKSYILQGTNPAVLGDWQELLTPTDSVASVAGKTGIVTLVKADVGLANVANVDTTNATNITSGLLDDARIPDGITRDTEVNTATQTVLNLKANLASPALTGTPTAPTAGAAINTTQIATTAYVKSQGYVTSSGVTSVSGTAPVVSSGGATPAISMAAATASVNGYMTSTYASKLDGIAAGAQVNTVTSVATKTGDVTLVKADVGLSNVDNTSDASKPVSTATQTALNGKANTTHNQAESTITFTDITTGNASVSSHGYLRKLNGSTSDYLRGDGTWVTPPGVTYAGGYGVTIDVSNNINLNDISSGSSLTGAVSYNGLSKASGKFDGGTVDPTNLTRLNYDGHLHATKFFGDGSGLTGVSPTGVAVYDDTTTSTNQYLAMSRIPTGPFTDLYIASTKLYFNPNTGTLNATIFNSLSDAAKKTNVVVIDDALTTVKKLQGVEFDWIDTGKKSAGVIAQELEKVLPHLVDTSSEGLKSVNYAGIIGYLVEAIKELSNK